MFDILGMVVVWVWYFTIPTVLVIGAVLGVISECIDYVDDRDESNEATYGSDFIEKVFGKNCPVETAGAWVVISFFLNIILSFAAAIRHADLETSYWEMFLDTQYTVGSWIASAIAVILAVWIPLYLARGIRRLSKKLKEHMEDKNAHK